MIFPRCVIISNAQKIDSVVFICTLHKDRVEYIWSKGWRGSRAP